MAASAATTIVAGESSRATPDLAWPEDAPRSPPTRLLAGPAQRQNLVAPPEERVVVYPLRADVAQLVEHNLAKVGVAGSNPVVRSIDTPEVGLFRAVKPPDRPAFIDSEA